MEMKKNRTEQQKDRAAIFDLAKGLTTIIVVGATLGALYEAPWELYFKVIVFGFMFLLGLIANELSRNGNAAAKSMDALMLIFVQLNLMGKKEGIKQDQASKTLEDLEDDVLDLLTYDPRFDHRPDALATAPTFYELQTIAEEEERRSSLLKVLAK